MPKKPQKTMILNTNTGVEFMATPHLLNLAKKSPHLRVIEGKTPLSPKEIAKLEEIAEAEALTKKAGGDNKPRNQHVAIPKDAPVVDDDDDTGDDTAGSVLDALEAQINGIPDDGSKPEKDVIEGILLENFAVDVDKRKSLKTLKAEALKVIEEQRAD